MIIKLNIYVCVCVYEIITSPDVVESYLEMTNDVIRRAPKL